MRCRGVLALYLGNGSSTIEAPCAGAAEMARLAVESKWNDLHVESCVADQLDPVLLVLVLLLLLFGGLLSSAVAACWMRRSSRGAGNLMPLPV